MAFPGSSWDRVGTVTFCNYLLYPADNWRWMNIDQFLRECQENRKEFRSEDFIFAGASWNVFASFHQKEVYSLFGISVRERRTLNEVLDCCLHVQFVKHFGGFCTIKSIKCNFKCEKSDTYCSMEDFLTRSELDMFLREGNEILCRLEIKKSSTKETCPRAETTHSSSSTVETHTQTELLESYSMAFPGSSWDRVGTVSFCSNFFLNSAEKWRWVNIDQFLRECQENRKEFRSEDFIFAGALCNFFASFHQKEVHSLFGISVRERRTLNEVLDCCLHVYFMKTFYEAFKCIKCNFKCENSDSYCSMENFFTTYELGEFLQKCDGIICRLDIKKSSIKETRPRAETTHSSSSTVETHTQTELLKSEDNATPKLNSVDKMCHDLKQLLLSEEGSDVTLQVQDQQFKAHRSILTSRSSVFAAMFRHDTKEKATGVVNVEDCEPSSFPLLLEFMYCCSVEKMSVENVFHLYTSADKYDMEDLRIECLEFIKKNLSVETFCETVWLALQHTETNLLDMAVEFFARNMKEIIVTVKWQAFLAENYIQCNELHIKASAYWQLKP